MEQNNHSSTYKTKQSFLVLECFENNKGKHLTIEEICAILKQNNTPVGTTTVYRHVQRLADEGIITKYTVDSESAACYQYSGEDCSMHFHLKCTSCQRLFHACCSYMDSIEEHISNHHGFKVDNSRTVFYGICQDCIRSKKKK